MKVSRNIIAIYVLGSSLLNAGAFVPQGRKPQGAGRTTSYSPVTYSASRSSPLYAIFPMGGAGRNIQTSSNTGYDMLKQPGVSAGSSLTRLGSPQTQVPTYSSTGAIQQQQQKQYADSRPDLKPIQIQGGSLKTWTFPNAAVESVQVFLKTEGRPLNANLEVWQGPDNTPMQVAVYLEDGSIRPFSAVIGTPRNYPSSISIRNTATMEFPMEALLEPDREPIEAYTRQALTPRIPSKTVQGGAVYTMPFSSTVQSVAMLLRTDGRPLNARIELLQGPNNNKQVMEVYSEDGLERPFFTIIETPGYGNVVRIVNTAVMEFPLTADIQPYMVDEGYDESFFFEPPSRQFQQDDWSRSRRLSGTGSSMMGTSSFGNSGSFSTGGSSSSSSNPYFFMNMPE